MGKDVFWGAWYGFFTAFDWFQFGINLAKHPVDIGAVVFFAVCASVMMTFGMLYFAVAAFGNRYRR